MIEINASKGLGDALYLRAIVAHHVKHGHEVRVFTQWPEVFRGIVCELRTLHEIVSHEELSHSFYCLACNIPAVRALDQWTMACLQAGISERIPFDLDWQPVNLKLLRQVQDIAAGRKVLVYQPPKRAHSAEQAQARPALVAFVRHLEAFDGWCRVKVGSPAHVVECDAPCEVDLFGRTSVADVLDVCTVGDACYADPSYLPVMFQGLGKPATVMFARAGFEARSHRIRNIRPERIFAKPHLATAIADR